MRSGGSGLKASHARSRHSIAARRSRGAGAPSSRRPSAAEGALPREREREAAYPLRSPRPNAPVG